MKYIVLGVVLAVAVAAVMWMPGRAQEEKKSAAGSGAAGNVPDVPNASDIPIGHKDSTRSAETRTKEEALELAKKSAAGSGAAGDLPEVPNASDILVGDKDGTRSTETRTKEEAPERAEKSAAGSGAAGDLPDVLNASHILIGHKDSTRSTQTRTKEEALELAKKVAGCRLCGTGKKTLQRSQRTGGRRPRQFPTG